MGERRGDISVICRHCGIDYDQRENMLTGEWLWFANCQCPKNPDDPNGDGYAWRLVHHDEKEASDG